MFNQLAKHCVEIQNTKKSILKTKYIAIFEIFYEHFEWVWIITNKVDYITKLFFEA